MNSTTTSIHFLCFELMTLLWKPKYEKGFHGKLRV